MSKSTISTFELFQMFPDQESARLYLESRLWPNGVICPTCRKGERITTRKGGYYRCNACQLDFTVRTGTIFERSHIPLHKWLYAMYRIRKAHITGESFAAINADIGNLRLNDHGKLKAINLYDRRTRLRNPGTLRNGRRTLAARRSPSRIQPPCGERES